MTVTTRQNYDKIMHNELDRLAENAFAREQGFAEGKAEGVAEGEAKGEAKEKANIAKAMLAEATTSMRFPESPACRRKKSGD